MFIRRHSHAPRTARRWFFMKKYLIIDLQKGSTAKFSFDGLNYSLSQAEVSCLIEKGVLHTSETETFYSLSRDDLRDLESRDPRSWHFKDPGSYYGYGCHRCRTFFQQPYDHTCPYCYSTTWDTYTLFYCCE